MSTGLISKKNRNVNEVDAGLPKAHMPDTPCKKQTMMFPPPKESFKPSHSTMRSLQTSSTTPRSPAEISFGSDGFVDAGTGQVDIRLFDGAGQTNFDRGPITLGNITAGIINVIAPEGLGGFADEVVEHGIPMTRIHLRENNRETGLIQLGDFGCKERRFGVDHLQRRAFTVDIAQIGEPETFPRSPDARRQGCQLLFRRTRLRVELLEIGHLATLRGSQGCLRGGLALPL